MRDGRRRALALVVLLAVLTGCGGDVTADPQGSTSTATTSSPWTTTSTTLPSIPEEDGRPLGPGTYRVSSAGRRRDRIRCCGRSWTTRSRSPRGGTATPATTCPSTRTVRRVRLSSVIYPVLVDEIYADPCEGERGPTVAVGPEVNDLVDALLAQPGTVTTEPVETTIGGLPATRVDLEVQERADLSSCLLADYGPPGLQIWFSDPADKYFVLMPGYTASVYVVDVDGERQVFLTRHGPAASDEDLRSSSRCWTPSASTEPPRRVAS